MTRQLRKVYVALFLAMLLLLGVLSVRAFSTFSMPPDATLVDGRMAKAIESHYDQQFPVKRLGTNLWAGLEYMLFGNGRPGVIIGREQWLFSDEEFKPVPDAERNIADNWALIQGVRNELARHDVRLVLAIVPAKNRIYPEYIGDKRPNALHDGLFHQFHQQARSASIVAPDLLTPLRRTKQRQGQVFLRTDTHWTPLGAEAVARQLGEAIRGKQLLDSEPQLFVTQVGEEKELEGDLVTFLPFDPLFPELLPPPDRLQQRVTEKADDAPADLFSDEQIPVALVGTSYSADPSWNFDGALREALMSDLTNHAESGRGPMLPMLKYLQSADLREHPPQVVIWEFPERYLPVANDLSDFDPKWITRLKAAHQDKQQLAGNLPQR